MKSRNRQGFAMVVALLAIVVVGGLVAGAFFSATQEYRIGQNNVLQARSLTAAEYGLNVVVLDSVWKSKWNTSTTTGVLDTLTYRLKDGSIDTIRVSNLGGGYFLVTSEARSGPYLGAQGRRRIAQLIALAAPNFNILGALTSRGPTTVGGSSLIDGSDTPVAGWDCLPPGADKPGIVVADASEVSTNGCTNKVCISGDPPVQQNPLAGADSTYKNFGGLDWAQLTGMAQKIYPANSTLNGLAPSFTGTACNTGDTQNWGDPLHNSANASCQTFFPIIYVQGDLKVTGGVGQGILLVQGNLEVAGGFEFYGPVVAQGDLKVTGTGGHFTGGVLAANVDLDQQKISGNALISYSSCAVRNAVAGTAKPVLANGRAWVELP